METIYNSPSLSNYFIIILATIVGLIILGLGIIGLIALIKGKANFFKEIILYLLCSVFILVGGYVVGTVSENIYLETRYVLVPYLKGEYEEIEGVIENCVVSEDDREASFEVNNIKFSCSNFEVSSVGYQEHSIKNGDYVRIRFLSFSNNDVDKNIIMKIEKTITT